MVNVVTHQSNKVVNCFWDIDNNLNLSPTLNSTVCSLPFKYKVVKVIYAYPICLKSFQLKITKSRPISNHT